ncbi:transporter substrate-binding domain-containing protein [Mesorhizobium sp. SB112]|uniref:transporter substrate-binding domain-containing protein n=1 Tax=Mesorhizobium sp. SB112 TaxID=3151853 RepID=UPI0032641D7C
MSIEKAMKTLCVTAALIIGLAVTAGAQSVEEIKARGKILVAMDLGSPPYAFTNAEQQPQGSDIEAAQLLAKDMGVELEIVPTNGQGRIPALLSKKADVVIATFSYTPERAKTVAFSDPYSFTRSVIFAEKDLPIASLEDLVGKKTGVARGTTPDQQLGKLLPSGAEIVRYDDDATTIAALASGQIDALGTADNRFLTLEERFPGRFEIKYEVDQYYLGVGLRLGNPELLAWLNAWVATNMDNNTLPMIYEKWLKQPLPKLPKLSEIGQ